MTYTRTKAGIFAVILLSSIVFMNMPSNAHAQLTSTATYTTIDLTGTPNTNDILMGADCSDSTWFYGTVYHQGSIYRVKKSTSEVEVFDAVAEASGKDLYSLVKDPVTSKIFANERDTGNTHVFDPASDSYVKELAIPEDVSGPGIVYTTTQEADPNKITESGNDKVFGFDSNSELRATNGYVWQPIDYKYDFTSHTDVEFHGIARINPSTYAIDRYAISGAVALAGNIIDTSDSTIIYVTDIGADKIYKFDTDTQSVTQTYTLPAGSKPRGLSDDGTYLWVAENTSSGTAKILKVKKSDGTYSEIDTGLTISGDGGTFTTFYQSPYVIFTDQSGHLGRFDPSNPSGTMTLINTSSNTDENHFGCMVGTEFWWSGQGSPILGKTSFAVANDNSDHSGGRRGDGVAPSFWIDPESGQVIKDSLVITTYNQTWKWTSDGKLWQHNNETVKVPVGKPATFSSIIADSYNNKLTHFEMAFGIPKGLFDKQQSAFIIDVDDGANGWRTTSEGDANLFNNVKVTVQKIENFNIVNITFTPLAHLQNTMFAREAWNSLVYIDTEYFNEGADLHGKSLIGTPKYEIQDNHDKTDPIKTVTIDDPYLIDMSKGTDEYGNAWTLDSDGWHKIFISPDNSCELTSHGYKKHCPEMLKLKTLEETTATLKFDPESVQNDIKDYTPGYNNPQYPRGHDSLQNMMKAQSDLAKKQAGQS